ncbi:hypothetical protein [Streptomyces sp. CC219B]|uniref:hypothetical protein n=1 Tax=Streptomyces sp. CC219B TaxID=3044574 RepID=UPI0024A9AA9B|nr:hypothetical protein [Streptomyces sp. CC219B]
MNGTARRRRAGLVLVVSAVLTACTGSAEEKREERGSARPPLAALRVAERATAAAHSVGVESTTVMGAELSIEADGVLGWRDDLVGSLTITYTGGTTAEAMRRLGVTSMQARYLPDAYYARMGDTFAARAGGKHWIRYDYDDLADLGDGRGATFAEQMRGSTPSQSVKLLLHSKDVREVGEETVDGRPTTHYSGTVPVGDVTDAALRDRLRQAGVIEQSVDIWVDDRNLLVKKVERGTMATGELTQTAHYSDYGVRVSVRKPPARDTEDFKDLLRRQGGTAS